MDERARSYLRTLVFAAALGVPVAFAAVLFQSALHHATDLVWEEIPHALDWTEPTWWYVVLVTGLAGVLVAAALRLPGHGGHSPLEGLGLGPTPLIELPSILLAAFATLALGLVLGPEAPLIALGLGLGSVAVRLVRVEGTEAELLVLAGAFAAIAALFGSPLVAAFLIFEIAVASGAIPAHAMGRALLPGFVAAGTGALVFTGVGDWPGLEPFSLAVPGLPAYDTVRIADLGWCLLIAAAVAAVIVALRHLAHEIAERARGRVAATLVASGLLVGVLAVLFRAIADRPVDLVLFSGQEAMPAVVAEASASVLLLLVAAKGLAYALSLGAGFRGGPVFPALLHRRGDRRARRGCAAGPRGDAGVRGRNRSGDRRRSPRPVHGGAPGNGTRGLLCRGRGAHCGARGCRRLAGRSHAPEPRGSRGSRRRERRARPRARRRRRFPQGSPRGRAGAR